MRQGDAFRNPSTYSTVEILICKISNDLSAPSQGKVIAPNKCFEVGRGSLGT